MSILDLVASRLSVNRRRLEAWLNARGIAHTLSLQRYLVHHRALPLLEAQVRGRCLDIGSGHGPYRETLDRVAERVITLDFENRSSPVDVLADVQAMPQIESSSIDSVLCAQVLEHLPRPWDALAEIYRVLRPGGALILSVPHLSVIHEAPHDYFRYTRFGLESLMELAGLEVDRVEEAGGLLSFLLHPVSWFLLSATAGVPLLREIVWLLNYVFLIRLLGIFDRLVGAPRISPCNYVVLAHKPGTR